MCEILVFNAQEIRENIYHIGKKVQLATETIFGTESLVVPSNRRGRIDRMDVELFNVIYSSDSDVDNNYFDEECTNISDDRTIPCAVVDILEENNNDNNPNNNLDSIQSYQEQENQISMVPDQIQRAEVAECASDLLPDCSKDFDEKESQYCDNTLQAEAFKINCLLHQFDYTQIFATLRKNQFAENRVLLTLWDLLPNKRPIALHQLVHKKITRNCKSVPSKFLTEDHAQTTFENNELILIENKNQNNASIVTRYITVSPVQDENEDTVLLDEISNFQNTGAIPKKKGSTQSNTVPQNQNGIFQPAKLMLNKISEKKCKKILVAKNPFEQNSTNNDKHNKLNKYMEYLEYMKNVKKQKNIKDFRNINFPVRNSIRQFFLHSKYKNFGTNIAQFIMKNNKSKVLNIADTNSNNDQQSKDKKQVCALFKYDTEDLQYLNGNTSSSENLDLLFGNKQTVAACNTPNAVSSCSTSNYLPMDTVDAPSVYHTNNIESICTAYNNPNNSNIPNSSTDQASIKKNVLPPQVEPIYNILLSIFPNIDEDYIKNLCFQHFEEHNNTFEMSEDLIDYILENKEKCPIKKDDERVCKEKAFIMNQQAANLFSIFPDADKAYLRKRVQLMGGNVNAITDFIETQCQKPTYITKKENVRRSEITKFQKQYFHNFNAEMFLELFPDPFKHFENIDRRCNYNDDALDFLYSRYNGLQEETLKQYYKNFKYNLSLSERELHKLYAPNKLYTMEYSNIYEVPLLQECAFILNKEEIRVCMNRIQNEENIEFEKLKRNNELLECEICYEKECMPSKCFVCNDGHIFCNQCIIMGVNVELGKGNVHIKCFLSDCNEEFSCSTLQKALPPTQFSILFSKKQETEVMAAGLEGLVSCPFCSFASIPPPEDKVFRCLNPDCMKESCRLCKMLNHVPFKCKEIETTTKKSKARILLEEKMTEALVRTCYKCSKPYFKESGCNLITCSCGARMCYICEQPGIDYRHFGSGMSCPQSSDSIQLNNDTIKAVANETIKYLAEKDIQIDGNPLLSQNEETRLSTVLVPEVSRRLSKVAKFNL